MSKRFGRNQKRKLLADRAGLAVQLKNEASRVAQLQHLMRRNADTISLVAEILGRNFAGLPANTVPVSKIPDCYRLPASVRRLTFSPSCDDLCKRIEYNLLEIFPMLTDAQQQYIQDQVHFYLKTPAGEVAYALEGRVWREQRGPEFRRRLIEEIARDMADHILRDGVRNETPGR